MICYSNICSKCESLGIFDDCIQNGNNCNPKKWIILKIVLRHSMWIFYSCSHSPLSHQIGNAFIQCNYLTVENDLKLDILCIFHSITLDCRVQLQHEKKNHFLFTNQNTTPYLQPILPYHIILSIRSLTICGAVPKSNSVVCRFRCVYIKKIISKWASERPRSRLYTYA